ncbi:MAG: class I mannose-6-phosphate isomerase [Planctomycetota bacterium]|nr:class I mannose-6-phosphate isomerase [Planctomycetota bacterium]
MAIAEPLTFRPILKPKIWGGRKLETVLGRPLPPGERIGESWEISDRPGEESIVAAGRHAGRTLGELMRQAPADILGGAAPARGRFPLLVKLLDASDVLSVQVHPDDRLAASKGDSGKCEAWVVIQADPGARMIRGLAPAVSRRDFAEALRSGGIEKLLRSFPVTTGDCIACPPGTVHAIGKGVLLVEIQQNSDLTYRVYDWGRTGDDGRPRPLHVNEALESIRFDDPGREFDGEMRLDVVPPGPWREEDCGRSRHLLSGACFSMGQTEISRAGRWRAPGGCRVLVVLEGAVELAPAEGADFEPLALRKGSCALIPASCAPLAVRPLDVPQALVLTAEPAAGIWARG